MNASWFDDLARREAVTPSRRRVIKGLLGGMLGLTALGTSGTRSQAATCAGIQESCADVECCEGYGCNEDRICIAAAECATLGQGCLTNEQCCSGHGLVCGDNKTCIAAAECATAGQGCKADSQCCGTGDLVCGDAGICVTAGGTSGSGEAGGTTTLPGTGAGPGRAGGRIAGAATAAGTAALVGGVLLRERANRGDADASGKAG